MIQQIIVLIAVFLDVIGIGILIPVSPALTELYGVSNFGIGIGLTLYSLFAFFAAPVLGQLSDKYGRKPLLLLCVIGSAFSYFILIVTSNYRLYLASRIINGITGGNISILQAIVADTSIDTATRTKNLGLIGAMFGLGFVVGPFLGGLLSLYSLNAVFGFGLLASIVEIFLIQFKLNETHEKIPTKKINFFPFHTMKKYFFKSRFSPLFRSLFMLGIGMFVYQSVLTLFLTSTYGISSFSNGLIFAFVGVITVINQAILLPKFWLKFFRTQQLMILIHLLLIPIYFTMSRVSNFTVFMAVFFITPFIQNLINPSYQSEILEKTGRDTIGEVNGVLGGMQSMSMFIGPLIGGYILDHQNISLFTMSGIFVTISLCIILYHVYFRNQEI